MKLTTENTAVVLDSTADFPEAPERFPNFRVVPLYVRFGDESFRDYVDITPDVFYERLPRRRSCRRPRSRRRATSWRVYEELAPPYERILSLQISSTLSGTFASAQAAAELLGGDQVRVIDSRTVSASIAMLALGVQRRLERGTTDEEIDALVARYARRAQAALHGQHARVPREGRPHRSRRRARRQLLNVKPILTIRDGEVVPLKKVRGNHKAFAAFRELFEETTTDSADAAVGIAHAVAPERLRGAARDRRARAAARADRDRDDARRSRRHARRAGHGRLLLVRRRRATEGPSGPGPILGPGGDDDPSARGFHRRGPARVAAAARLGRPASSSTRSGSTRCPASGAALAKRLRALGLETVRDLLLHRPRRYEQRRRRDRDLAALGRRGGGDRRRRPSTCARGASAAGARS